MTASIVYGNLWDSNNKPIGGRPFKSPMGVSGDTVVQTLATTSLDEAGDVVHLIPVPAGARLFALFFDSAAFDSGTAIDMDLVLRTTNSAGSHTDTILYNAGTAFEAALTNQYIPLASVVVPSDADDVASIITYVNTAATTAVSGDISLTALWR